MGEHKLEKAETPPKKVFCPVCNEEMNPTPANKVFGFRDNLLMLLINEDIQVMHCPKCTATMLYDDKEMPKILTPEKKIITGV